MVKDTGNISASSVQSLIGERTLRIRSVGAAWNMVMLRRVSEAISMQGRSWIFLRRAVQPPPPTEFPQRLEQTFLSEALYMSFANAPERPLTDRYSERHLEPSIRV